MFKPVLPIVALDIKCDFAGGYTLEPLDASPFLLIRRVMSVVEVYCIATPTFGRSGSYPSLSMLIAMVWWHTCMLGIAPLRL